MSSNNAKRRKTYKAVLDVETGYYLDLSEQAGWFSVIIPEERINYVLNPMVQLVNGTRPSWTLNSGSWSDRPLVGSTLSGFYYRNYVSLSNTGSAYTSLTALPNGRYAVSIWVCAEITEEVDVILSFTSNAGFMSQKTATINRNGWQQITIFVNYNGELNPSVQIDVATGGANLLIGGVQVERGNWATTFIHGFRSGRYDEPTDVYRWFGAPHNSISLRSADTIDGGRVVNLRQLGAYLTGVEGLGLPEFEHSTTVLANRKGSLFNCYLLEERDVCFSFNLYACSFKDLLCTRNRIGRAIFQDGKQRTFLFQPTDCDEPIGECIKFTAALEDGFNAETESVYGEEIEVCFKMYDVEFYSCIPHYEDLTAYDVVNYARILGQTTLGKFSDFGAAAGVDCPCSANNHPAIVEMVTSDLTGNLYVAVTYDNTCTTCGGFVSAIWQYDGEFWTRIAHTTAGQILTIFAHKQYLYFGTTIGTVNGDDVGGGTSGARFGRFNFFTRTVENIGNVFAGDEISGGNGRVSAFASTPDGRLFMAGNFQSINGGTVNSYRVVMMSAAGNWVAMSTSSDLGALGNINSLAYDTVRQRLYIGGDFRDAGAVSPNYGAPKPQGFAVWNDQTKLYTVNRRDYFINAPNLQGIIHKLIVYNGEVIALGENMVDSFMGQPGSNMYWLDESRQYPGTAGSAHGEWKKLGGYGVIGPIYDAAVCNGELHIVGNIFNYGPASPWNQNTALGYIIYQSNGSLDGGIFRMPTGIGLSNATAITCGTDKTDIGIIYGNQPAYTGAPNTIEVPGYAEFEICRANNPVGGRLFITGPGRIEKIHNTVTNGIIYFNYSLSTNEVLIFDFSRSPVTVKSSLSGNLSALIEPGSTPTLFNLVPGINALQISFVFSTTDSNTKIWYEFNDKTFSADSICEGCPDDNL